MKMFSITLTAPSRARYINVPLLSSRVLPDSSSSRARPPESIVPVNK